MKIEINKNLEFLKRNLGVDVNSFAYPFGAYNNNVVKYLKKIKIDYAFDTRTEGKNYKYNIRRNDVADYFNKQNN